MKPNCAHICLHVPTVCKDTDGRWCVCTTAFTEFLESLNSSTTLRGEEGKIAHFYNVRSETSAEPNPLSFPDPGQTPRSYGGAESD